MNHFWKSAVAGFAALTLASCAGLELQKAELVEPSGTQFDNSLAKDYLTLSKDEYREGDYWDSDVFAVASMDSAQGNPVLPEEMSSRVLPEDKVGELSAARARLMTALDAGARDVIPDQAALAQACWDGWFQEQEEDFQPEDIAERRDCFMDAMAKVEAAMMASPRAPYMVFFDFARSNLTPEAMQIVQSAAVAAKQSNASGFSVVGHTDTVGSASYNMALGMRRAVSVKRALVNMGFAPSSITTASRGKNDLLVPTGNNVREAQNRRAVIVIQK